MGVNGSCCVYQTPVALSSEVFPTSANSEEMLLACPEGSAVGCSCPCQALLSYDSLLGSALVPYLTRARERRSEESADRIGRMSMVTHSRKRNRAYLRKFDHDEARKRHASGESVAALAREYGVTWSAVQRVVDPITRERAALSSAARFARHGNRSQYWPCPECGGRARKGHLCRRCHLARLRGGRDLFDKDGRMLCTRCGEYRPADEFGWRSHTKAPDRGFRRSTCRRCETQIRRAYRERCKVPCVVCGAPALPPEEKRTRGAGFARCRACYRARRGPE
jgi:hypothetical protein